MRVPAHVVGGEAGHAAAVDRVADRPRRVGAVAVGEAGHAEAGVHLAARRATVGGAGTSLVSVASFAQSNVSIQTGGTLFARSAPTPHAIADSIGGLSITGNGARWDYPRSPSSFAAPTESRSSGSR